MELKKFFCALVAVFALGAGGARAAIEIRWWHSMAGALGEGVVDIADKFNASQSAYRLVPVFKGAVEGAVSASAKAPRSAKAPHIVQVFDAGTAAMMVRGMGIKPVYAVMAQAGEKFDGRAYLPAVADHYSDTQGRLLSLPFDSATPVFYFNKDAFRRAGLDPSKPPATWDEVQEAALKLNEAGVACAFTTGWQSWVQLEAMSAWHNQDFATRKNGFAGLDAKLAFNNQILIRHIAKLASWAKSGLFTYGGRANEAAAKFSGGECAMLTSSSAAYADIKRDSKFEFGVSRLPYYEDVRGAPQNPTVGGDGLWVASGKSAAEYKGVAKFFVFLSSPDIQAYWHQKTGYLPLTRAAYELTRKQGYYEANPGAEVAIRQLLPGAPGGAFRGIRLGNFAQIRHIIDEELESVWVKGKSPKQALDDSVARGNAELRKFERASKTG